MQQFRRDGPLGAWRRRAWRADPVALAPFDGLKPIKVVTGGSSGIGLAVAVEFARLGDHVLIVGRDPARLASACATIKATAPAGSFIEGLACDVTAADALVRIDAALTAAGGYCDVLVNSAGIGSAGTFASAEPDQLEQLATLNVTALTRLCRHFLPGMLVRGRGGILNVASLGGYVPGPYQAAYYASKSYVLSLTEALAHECAGRGVRITALAPGPVRTTFHERMNGANALYVRLLPTPSAAHIARRAVLGFRLGLRVVVPGLVSPLLMLPLKLLPHRLTVPLVALLLAPRRWLRDKL